MLIDTEIATALINIAVKFVQAKTRVKKSSLTDSPELTRGRSPTSLLIAAPARCPALSSPSMVLWCSVLSQLLAWRTSELTSNKSSQLFWARTLTSIIIPRAILQFKGQAQKERNQHICKKIIIIKKISNYLFTDIRSQDRNCMIFQCHARKTFRAASFVSGTAASQRSTLHKVLFHTQVVLKQGRLEGLY